MTQKNDNKCPICKNKLKNTIKEEIIKTRLENRKEITIENLPIRECTVCDYTEVPQKSEELKDIVKYLVKRELKKSTVKNETNTNNRFMKLIKKIIS